MAYSDQLLQGTQLTEQSILEDLEALQLYYEDMEIPCKIIRASKPAPLPSLVAMLDTGEEEKPWVLTHSLLPVDKELAEFTKFLQFYCELPGALEQVDRVVLLEAVNRLGQALPFGTALLVEPRPELKLPLMAAVRAVQGFPLEQPMAQAVFTEDLFLFETSCQITTQVMEGLCAGLTVDQAFARVGQSQQNDP